MKGRVSMRALLLGGLLAAMLAPAQAQAGSLHVSVAPTHVGLGRTLTVRVTHTRSRRCVLTLRMDRFGAVVRYRRAIAPGRTVVRVRSSWPRGARVAMIRCGAHVARFTVGRAPVQGRARPAPDAQGFVPLDSGNQDIVPPGLQLGGGDYPNSRIADIGLSKVGQNLYTPGWLDHGQCKQAVNDWVAAASGGTQRMGTDYYTNYARNGGTQVARDDAIKGDIIQLDNPSDIANYYRGMHTAVVVSHTPGSNTFDVVDSNWEGDDIVRHHTWDPYASGAKYGLRVTIWRMGSTDTSAPTPTPTPTPTPQPQPQPTPPPPHVETTGGVTHTWTNWTNAGGTQGPSIPSNASVEIACKLQGFRVADGNTWWYRIHSGPWSDGYYAAADAFYNNGQTSGSLVGTPFVDPAVPDC